MNVLPGDEPTDGASRLCGAVATASLAALVLVAVSPLLSGAVEGEVRIPGLLDWAQRDVINDRQEGLLYRAGLLLAALIAVIGRNRVAGSPGATRTAARLGICLATAVAASFVLRLPPAISVAAAVPAAGLVLRAWLRATPGDPLPRSQVPGGARAVRWGPLDALLPVLLAAWVWLRAPAGVAGLVHVEEEMHHWDVFVRAPQILSQAGWGIGSDAPVMYGVGISALMRWLMDFSGESGYAALVRVANVAQILYFVLWYLALRLLGFRRFGAAAAVIVGLAMREFHSVGYAPHLLVRYPAGTPLRCFVDVLWVLALIGHVRTGREYWVLLSGALTGIALWLVTDVGTYLLLAHVTYALLSARRGDLSRRGAVAAVLLPVLVAALATVMQLGTAALSSPAFLDNLLGEALLRMRGYAVLRASLAGPGGLLVLGLPFLYVVVSLSCAADRRSAAAPLWAAFALYGMASYHYFVARSNWFAWFRVCLPGVLLAAELIRSGEWRGLLPARQAGWSRSPAFARAALGVIVLAAVAASPKLHDHPNYMGGGSASAAGRDPEMERLAPTESMLLPPVRAEEIRQGAAAIEDLVPPGGAAAVISDSDTLYYALTARRPFSPRLPLLHMTHSRAHLDDLFARLDDPSIDVVFVDVSRPLFHWSKAILARVRERLPDDFSTVERRGVLEIWRRR